MSAAHAFDVETRTLLCDGLRRFSRERRSTSIPASDATAAILTDWSKLAEQGWLGLGLPEVLGGGGGTVADLSLMLIESGAALWRTPLVQCLGEACGALLAAPAGKARDGLLQAIATGNAIAGLAATDGSVDCVPAVAQPVGAAFRITGRKCFLPAGDAWTHFLVTARHAVRDDSSTYLVDATAPGLKLRRFLAIDGRSAADLDLHDVHAQLIADGSRVLSAARRRGEVLAAAEQAGIAHAVLDATKHHLAQRSQFGQPLLRFQAVQHRLVEAYICARELSALLEVACSAYAANDAELDRLLCKLRAQASLTATRVAQQGIQLHGGMGMTAAMPLGDYYKRAMLIDSLFGSYESALDLLAAQFESN
jgi:alkylation response protein AidB-like acyl-CoA dehydrogenase